MSENNNNGKYKISIESRLTSLEVKVNEIITNHLPHLEESIRKVDERVWWILGGVILSIVIQVVLKF